MGAPFSFYDTYQNQNGEQETNTDREIRKGFFSKFLVALIISTNIVFTIAVLIIFCVTYTEPATLIMAWFGFTTGELWFLCTIKKSKQRKDDTNATDRKTFSTKERAFRVDNPNGSAEADSTVE